MQITMRRLGVKSWRPGLDHADHALDHLLGGLEVGDHAIAQRPHGLDVLVRLAVHLLGLAADGDDLARWCGRWPRCWASSTTTLSLWMISVLAVPRSIAISWVKKLNQLMLAGQCLKWRVPVMHMAIPVRVTAVDALLVTDAAARVAPRR
jgi:hypothetical protein